MVDNVAHTITKSSRGWNFGRRTTSNRDIRDSPWDWEEGKRWDSKGGLVPLSGSGCNNKDTLTNIVSILFLPAISLLLICLTWDILIHYGLCLKMDLCAGVECGCMFNCQFVCFPMIFYQLYFSGSHTKSKLCVVLIECWPYMLY